MPGGNFVAGVEKERAGLYVNFKVKAQGTVDLSERGVVTIPLSLNWGQSGAFLNISSEGDFLKKLGYSYSASEVRAVREAFKCAKTVLVYRVNGLIAQTAKNAVITWGTTVVGTAKAKYAGTRGNDIKIIVADDVADVTKKNVETYVANVLVDTQKVETFEGLVANDWVTFSGTGIPELTSGATLATGANGTVTNEDYTNYLVATETQLFNTIAFPTTDETLKASFVSFIKRMRDEEGRKVQGVLASFTGADYEGIINVTNGVELSDGTKLDSYGAVPWVAGASASAQINESNTYRVYQGAIDANPRLRHSEIVDAIKNGELVFFYDGKNTKVEQDINSLVTYTIGETNEQFSSNRVIRTLDAVNNDLMNQVSESYIGKVNNDPDGQALLKDAVNIYLQTLQDNHAIKNFDPETDFVINTENSVGRSIHATIGVQPVESMEKFYLTVEVS